MHARTRTDARRRSHTRTYAHRDAHAHLVQLDAQAQHPPQVHPLHRQPQPGGARKERDEQAQQPARAWARGGARVRQRTLAPPSAAAARRPPNSRARPSPRAHRFHCSTATARAAASSATTSRSAIAAAASDQRVFLACRRSGRPPRPHPHDARWLAGGRRRPAAPGRCALAAGSRTASAQGAQRYTGTPYRLSRTRWGGGTSERTRRAALHTRARDAVAWRPLHASPPSHRALRVVTRASGTEGQHCRGHAPCRPAPACHCGAATAASAAPPCSSGGAAAAAAVAAAARGTAARRRRREQRGGGGRGGGRSGLC